jgi:hypothetical protein
MEQLRDSEDRIAIHEVPTISDRPDPSAASLRSVVGVRMNGRRERIRGTSAPIFDGSAPIPPLPE